MARYGRCGNRNERLIHSTTVHDREVSLVMVMFIGMKELSKRWKGTTKKARTEEMRTRAQQLQAKKTPEEKRAHALKMVKARGKWVGRGSNRIYVRNVNK